MPTDTFTASVKYNDYKGTVAADRADNNSLNEYLIKQGHCQQDEHVVGYRMCFSENHGEEISPGIVCYLMTGNFDDPNRKIRAIEIEMPMPLFFSFFKRFDLVMTTGGETFEGVHVDGPHY